MSAHKLIFICKHRRHYLDEGLTHAQIAVLEVVADSENHKYQRPCFKSIQTIATEAGVSRAYASGTLALAEREGLILVPQNRGKRHKSRYGTVHRIINDRAFDLSCHPSFAIDPADSESNDNRTDEFEGPDGYENDAENYTIRFKPNGRRQAPPSFCSEEVVAGIAALQERTENKPEILTSDASSETVPIAGPSIADYAAERLSAHSRKAIASASLTALNNKRGNLHAILDYALVTESWCSLLKKAEKPAGLLISQWSKIAESYEAAFETVALQRSSGVGPPSSAPPTSENVRIFENVEEEREALSNICQGGCATFYLRTEKEVEEYQQYARQNGYALVPVTPEDLEDVGECGDAVTHGMLLRIPEFVAGLLSDHCGRTISPHDSLNRIENKMEHYQAATWALGEDTWLSKRLKEPGVASPAALFASVWEMTLAEYRIWSKSG